MVVRGSVIGALVLIVIISLAVTTILCKIVLDNRRMKKKIKSQKERRRLTSVTNCSTDGSLAGDNDSLVDNDAYISSTQVIETPVHASNTMKEQSVRPYSTVDNQVYGSAERDTVFTSSKSTYEYI